MLGLLMTHNISVSDFSEMKIHLRNVRWKLDCWTNVGRFMRHEANMLNCTKCDIFNLTFSSAELKTKDEELHAKLLKLFIITTLVFVCQERRDSQYACKLWTYIMEAAEILMLSHVEWSELRHRKNIKMSKSLSQKSHLNIEKWIFIFTTYWKLSGYR